MEVSDGFKGETLEGLDIVAFEPLLGKVAEDGVDIGAALVERWKREDASKEVIGAGKLGSIEVLLLRGGE